MSEKSKTGSPIRKGFVYQDITALRFALELYGQHQEFRLFIDYEKIGNLDDIVVERGDSDTQACITGGIAQAYYKKIPDYIINKVKQLLDGDLLAIVDKFSKRYDLLGGNK